MSLSKLTFKTEYRSGIDNILDSLYWPALRQSVHYWRAVGFFSSSALESIGAPLGSFVGGGGRMRLITSVRLSDEDRRAIEAGLEPAQVVEERILEEIRTEFASPLGRGTFLLTKLLAAGRLEIRIARPLHGTGIYHEKVGIFLDADHMYLAFTGSSNESRTAFESNYECIDIFASWTLDATRARSKYEHFSQLWDGTAPGVDTMPFPEAARRALLVKHDAALAAEQEERRSAGFADELWTHQREAIDKFLTEKRGILEMATGTGKTRTALRICRDLLRSNEIDTIIVGADGTDLLDQWYVELLKLTNLSLKPLTILRHYGTHHQRQQFELRHGATILLISRRQIAPALKTISPAEGHRALLIHDEVHKLGSEGNRVVLTGLSHRIRYRLGLSATPEREYDQFGNAFINDHVGPVLFQYPLEDAIRDGILAPFNYHALSYIPDADDRSRLQNVYKQAAARQRAGSPMSQEELWTELARVYKTSRAKLDPFRRFVNQNASLLRRCIIFVETKEYGDEVLQLVHRLRHDFHTYYAEEDTTILSRFASGELQCLITCHRLSEGIDIRSLESVILFSSARARLETIQRIGRCLRIDPANPRKRAHVVDFIRKGEDNATDGDTVHENADDIRAQWLSQISLINSRSGDHAP